VNLQIRRLFFVLCLLFVALVAVTTYWLWRSPDLEARRGINSPAELFAIMESALRHHQGLGVEEHRNRIAELYSRFSEIAAANPQAWRREPVPAAEIRDPTGKNAMIAFPYTKRHCSQWNVNRAAAILVCSAGYAAELGLDRSRWIFPVAATESKHVVVLAQQKQLFSHPGTVMAGERAFALAGIGRNELDAVELYSCFPAAIQSFAHDLQLPPDRPLTVTGAMPFSGGPYNHFSLDGVARMADVLRDSSGSAPARRFGLVTNLSGIFGKQACALFSNAPGADGYRFEDVTAAVAGLDPPLPLDDAYEGPATVVGYTVVFAGSSPSHAIAYCDTAAGARTVARSEDRTLMERLMQEEFCGRTVRVRRDGFFS